MEIIQVSIELHPVFEDYLNFNLWIFIKNFLLVEGGVEILSFQDIDRMSKELILPSLNMTKSSSFIPNSYQYSLDNSLNTNESPYSQGVNNNISPN